MADLPGCAPFIVGYRAEELDAYFVEIRPFVEHLPVQRLHAYQRTGLCSARRGRPGPHPRQALRVVPALRGGDE